MPQIQERPPVTPFTEAALYLTRLARQAESAGNKRSAQILLNTARLLEVDSESSPKYEDFSDAHRAIGVQMEPSECIYCSTIDKS
jgi:hypothetical protein